MGKPILLNFTGEHCTACKIQQTPFVEKIRSDLGDSIMIEIYDVSDYPEVANQYKVLTLPTTVVLTNEGRVKAINYGITQQRKLETQLL